MATDEDDCEEMLKSAYEIQREQRIKENEAMLLALGLQGVTGGKGKGVPPADGEKLGRKRAEPPRESSRQSKRLRGIKPTGGLHAKARAGGGGGDDGGGGGASDDASDDEDETRANRMLKYEKLLERHALNNVELPPRATYKHTVHRVLSMSEKALLNRVKSIERAAGIYAVVKMRMFAEVLILEGQ